MSTSAHHWPTGSVTRFLRGPLSRLRLWPDPPPLVVSRDSGERGVHRCPDRLPFADAYLVVTEPLVA